VIVIAEMLGIDPADRAHFKRWGELDIRTFNPFLSEEERVGAAVTSALGERDAYLHRVLARLRGGETTGPRFSVGRCAAGSTRGGRGTSG
jgi:cytochrome P450